MLRRYWPLLLLLQATACAQQDPFERPYTWNASMHVNDANLRVMIANPADLQRGRGEDTAPASEASAPVKRLISGHRYGLQDSNVLQIQVGGQQEPQGQGSDASGQ